MAMKGYTESYRLMFLKQCHMDVKSANMAGDVTIGVFRANDCWEVYYRMCRQMNETTYADYPFMFAFGLPHTETVVNVFKIAQENLPDYALEMFGD